MVNPLESQHPSDPQAEVSRLRSELQMRDRLVQQLSQELFRLVKGNNNGAIVHQNGNETAKLQTLHQQLQEVEEQVEFYQAQIGDRDSEIVQLRQTVSELTDRARMLEQVVQELPEIYRQKFAERLEPIKEEVAALQQENRRLHAELQSVSYRLALRSRQSSGQLDLPAFQNPQPQADKASLPSFGNSL